MAHNEDMRIEVSEGGATDNSFHSSNLSKEPE